MPRELGGSKMLGTAKVWVLVCLDIVPPYIEGCVCAGRCWDAQQNSRSGVIEPETGINFFIFDLGGGADLVLECAAI